MDQSDQDLLEAMHRGRMELERQKLREAKAVWRANPEQPYILTFSGPPEDRPHPFCGIADIPGGKCPVHQVGGFPMIWNPQEVMCPGCGAIAPFFATICDNTEGQEYQPDVMKTFVGNCGVQMVFHWCAKCSIMTAYHSCD